MYPTPWTNPTARNLLLGLMCREEKMRGSKSGEKGVDHWELALSQQNYLAFHNGAGPDQTQAIVSAALDVTEY
jgi:hypothetical protein